MLDVEAALARAGAAAGLVPAAAAARISAACEDVTAYDVAALGREAAASSNPVVPLVRRIEAVAGPEAGAHVHRGATSQDVLDTAMVLLARRAIDLLATDLADAAEAAAALAERHRSDPVAGRTLLQQALPTTFGLKAAGWLTALDGAEDRLRAVSASLPVQLFGAVGTFSALEGRGLPVLEALAAELDLAVPVLPWHTARLPVGDLAGALGAAAGVCAKVALDLVLLAQTEVGEVTEGAPGRGGSSAMPHKQNPVAAVAARAAATRAPGLVATLLTSMAQEHERAAGAWQAEWETLSQLLRAAGSAASWLSDALEQLHVDVARMRANLEATSGAVGAEALAGAVAPALGRAAAHDLVARAVRRAQAEGTGVATAIADDPELAPHLRHVDVTPLLDPASSVGEAPALVDRALAAHASRRGAR